MSLSARLAATSVVVAGALFGVMPMASATPAPAVVVLVHGVRGLVADVYLDGQLTLPSFQPERSTDPLSLPAGPHTVEVRAAGANASGDPLLRTVVTLIAGAHESAVVHLDANSQPVVTLFEDDVSVVAAGQSRIVVRHAAGTGPIDVSIDGRPTATALANGQQNVSVRPAGSRQLAVTAGGVTLLPAQTIPIAEGAVTFVYLIGSQGSGTLAWTAVKLAGVQTPPARVQTGDGSSRTSRDLAALALPIGLMIAGAVLGTGVTLAAGRARRRV